MSERLSALVDELARHSELSAPAIRRALSALKPSTVDFIAGVVAADPSAALEITVTTPNSMLQLAREMHRLGSTTPRWPSCPRCSQQARVWLRDTDGSRICRRCHDNFNRGSCSRCGRDRILVQTRRGPGICQGCNAPPTRRSCVRCGHESTVGSTTPDGFVCVTCTPSRQVECRRCGRLARPASRMFGGFVCGLCRSTVVRNALPCPGCGDVRILSELGPDGQSVCAGCARVPARHGCKRCGSELFKVGSLCGACALSDVLDETVGPSGSGAFADALRAHFTARPNPRHAYQWIDRSPHRPLLSAMAAGATPVTHDSIDRIPSGRKVEFVRELLIACGQLPAIDLELHSLERWVAATAAAAPTDMARVVGQFASWEIVRRLRHQSQYYAPVRKTQAHTARNIIRGILHLLGWLAARGASLETMTQRLHDEYSVEMGRPLWLPQFVRWARRAHGTPARPGRATRPSPMPTISESERLAVYRQIVNDSSPARQRLACGILVVFGVPHWRIAEMKPSMFRDTGKTVSVHFRAGKPTPLPTPLAELYREVLGSLPEDSPWLFVGRRFGRHISPNTIGRWMEPHGSRSPQLRVAALFHLAGSMSSKVLENTTGISRNSASQYVALSGGAWNEISVLYEAPDAIAEQLARLQRAAPPPTDR